jgi:inorganic triphosphatase YgiF
MALMLDSLYDALKAAGAPDEQARAAARDVAGYDNQLNRLARDLSILKWMVGVLMAMVIGVFWMQWQVMDRLSRIEARLSVIESQMDALQRPASSSQTLGLADEAGS